MLNELLVACVRVAVVAVSLSPAPPFSIVRFANVATPFTAFTGPLPDSVAPPALPRAREIAPVKLGTVFPDASRSVADTAGVMSPHPFVLRGCLPNGGCVARCGCASVMLTALLVAGVRLPPVATILPPRRSSDLVRFANVATPFTAFTGPLPDSVAPPALPRAREIAPVKLGTVFPDASRAVTVTAGAIATTTCVLHGCTPNARCVERSDEPTCELH